MARKQVHVLTASHESYWSLYEVFSCCHSFIHSLAHACMHVSRDSRDLSADPHVLTE